MNRRILRSALLALAILAPALVASVHAEESELPRALSIEPSTAAAPLRQHATLTVSLLKRKGEGFVGSYTIVFAPLPLANETGSLEVRFPPDVMRELARKHPVPLTGSATSDAGKPRSIKGTAKPSSADGGAVHLEIHSERGTLQFDTAYRMR